MEQQETFITDRVKITYASTQEDGSLFQRELPLHMMIIGDFKGQASEVPMDEREAIEINSDNFNDVLVGMSPQVNCVVPNKLHDSGELPIQLTIQSMQDFEPDNLIHNVPELHKLVRFRQLLVRLKQHPEETAEIVSQLHRLDSKFCGQFLWMLYRFSYANRS